MSINITIKDPTPEEVAPALPPPQEKPRAPLSINLVLRKSIDGSLMILDHPELDIVINPAANKVVAFPKDLATDDTYGAQSRLFRHLVGAGMINPDTVSGGAAFGSLEGIFLTPANSEFGVVDLAVLSIGKFLEKELPEYAFTKAYDQEIEDMYVDPDDVDTTPLGKVPQSVKKGSVSPYDVRMYLMGLY